MARSLRSMRRSHLPRSAMAVAACLFVAACTSSPSASTTTVGGGPAGSTDGSSSPGATSSGATSSGATSSGATSSGANGSIAWKNAAAAGVQTGHLLVPIDYKDPAKGTFDLYLARHLANPKHRIGSLLINPGGPGFGGTEFAILATGQFDPALIDRFDIVAWDPRGTGKSTPPIDCIDDYDHFFTGTDITPDTPQERRQLIDLAKEFAADCVSKSGAIMPFVGTNNSARDIDSIRRALGEPKISYLGFSYGSELGAVWATMFPHTVRAAALDGAADPNADPTQYGIEQNAGFEQAISTFLAGCSANQQCAFHNDGKAEQAFDALMASIDDHPIRTVNGRPPLTRAMALTGVADAIYFTFRWPTLESALAAAQKGDGSGLLALFDEYYRRGADGKNDNSLEAFQVISCVDRVERPTVAADDATAPAFNKAAPRFSPSTVGSYTCTFFPPSEDPMAKVTGKGAGPILVMGTTGDPATPLASTRKMAAALAKGHLVVVKAEGHTGYHANACSGSVVDDYLIDPVGKVPPAGTTC